MRFLFYDRVIALEPGRRIVATKSVSTSDEFLDEHYPRQPLMPASLMLESLAQVSGWLHIVTEGFAVRTVLGMVEGVQVFRHARPGDTLTVESWLEFRHRDGASLRGELRVSDECVMRVARLLFASERTADAAEVARAQQLFTYLSGGFCPAGR